jgi:hypothetical protein
MAARHLASLRPQMSKHAGGAGTGVCSICDPRPSAWGRAALGRVRPAFLVLRARLHRKHVPDQDGPLALAAAAVPACHARAPLRLPHTRGMSIDGAESEEDAQELSFYALRSARRPTQPPSTARARDPRRPHPNPPHVRAACMRAPARVALSQAACSPLTARTRAALTATLPASLYVNSTNLASPRHTVRHKF